MIRRTDIRELPVGLTGRASLRRQNMDTTMWLSYYRMTSGTCQEDPAPSAFRMHRIANAVEIGLEAKPVSMKVANVVATLPGSDPSLSNEWIVFSGHYDHLGMIEASPGADDNASGVAAVLALQRVHN